jgi:hypothetical protein
MFIGHYAVSLAAKRAAPRTSLGTLIAATAFLDLVWPILVLAGVEHVEVDPGNTAFTPLAFTSYPWSHSLLMSVLWAVLFGAAYYAVRPYRAGALVVGALVFSHWVLDAIVHRPDLPLTPHGSTRVGLGLWNSIPGTLVVELAMFAAGVWLYVSSTRARNRVGNVGLAALIITLLVIYTANLLGPPPPSATAIAWTDMGQWLVVAWAAWVDRHRTPSSQPTPALHS